MSDTAALLLPAIRWHAERGFDEARPEIERALALGVGGFIVFGGPAEAVRELTRELHARARLPLLVGADLERGAGQQFAGLTGLPPLAALGWLGEADAVHRAARLTAREARRVGVNWVYGPVCDLDAEPDNPIVGTRAFGADPGLVAELAAEWVDGCQHEGVLACAKHFPGHGRTTGDSHMELPAVRASADTLYAEDLAPFRAALDAGVASVMSAHVAYPALDATGAPATLSPA
jgi:beta-glucosidase